MPGADGQMRDLHVIKDKFERSVHGKQQCVGCHQDITEIPHKKNGSIKVGCVRCHQNLWATAQKENKTGEFATLGLVAEQIDRYMKSIQLGPISRTNHAPTRPATTAMMLIMSIRDAVPSAPIGA